MVSIGNTIIYRYNKTYIAGYETSNITMVFNRLEEKEEYKVNLTEVDYGEGLISRDLNKW